MSEPKLNPFGEWYKLVHTCSCGSGMLYERWVLDEEGKRLFTVCESCKERRMRERDSSPRVEPDR